MRMCWAEPEDWGVDRVQGWAMPSRPAQEKEDPGREAQGEGRIRAVKGPASVGLGIGLSPVAASLQLSGYSFQGVSF